MQPPLIAVNGLALTEPRPGLRLDDRYAEAVLAAGGVPVAIPPVGDAAALERLLDRVDGVLLTGGDDFDTDSLGQGATHPSAVVTPPAKQAFDLELTRQVLARDLPVLGICYGMQCLGLVGGARLLQHLPDDRPGSRDHTNGVRHDVTFDPATVTRRVVGADRIEVVSRHHQALADAPDGWVVTARDDEGLLEGIECPTSPFAIGVQWHPELSPAGDPNAHLFTGLVGAASRTSSERAAHATGGLTSTT